MPPVRWSTSTKAHTYREADPRRLSGSLPRQVLPSFSPSYLFGASWLARQTRPRPDRLDDSMSTPWSRSGLAAHKGSSDATRPHPPIPAEYFGARSSAAGAAAATAGPAAQAGPRPETGRPISRLSARSRRAEARHREAIVAFHDAGGERVTRSVPAVESASSPPPAWNARPEGVGSSRAR